MENDPITSELRHIAEDKKDDEPAEDDIFLPTSAPSGILQSYSYDITAAEVDVGRKPTARVAFDDNDKVSEAVAPNDEVVDAGNERCALLITNSRDN